MTSTTRRSTMSTGRSGKVMILLQQEQQQRRKPVVMTTQARPRATSKQTLRQKQGRSMAAKRRSCRLRQRSGRRTRTERSPCPSLCRRCTLPLARIKCKSCSCQKRSAASEFALLCPNFRYPVFDLRPLAVSAVAEVRMSDKSEELTLRWPPLESNPDRCVALE